MDEKIVEETINAIDRLADDELIATVKSLAVSERHATARLIAALVELERRRLYLGAGCSSLYTYCMEVLHLSEDQAYNRVHAARVGLRFPVVLRDLDDGAVSMTTVRLLERVLTPENHSELLAAVRHKGKREVEAIVAAIDPSPPDEDYAVLRPVGPDRYRIEFTAPLSLYEKLRHAQDLLGHSVPVGEPAAIFERALDVLLTKLERTKGGSVSRTRRPRPLRPWSRAIPAHVSRAVWRRDGARCAFVGPEGRCTERRFLQLHHVQAFADDGKATVENVQLRCRAHNLYEAEQWFGPSVVREEPPEYGLGHPFRNG
jgi:hypothetical protein